MKQTGKNIVVTVALLVALWGFGWRADAQQVALRSNALRTVLLTPDLGVDLVTGEHSSVSLSVFGNWKPYGIDSKLIAVQPQFRWWFNGRPLVREYVGVAALFTDYDISWGQLRCQGLAGGLGLTGGYVLPLGNRWGIEFSGGLGVVLFRQHRGSRYDNFDYLDGGAYTSRGYNILPMNVGVTFIYIIK